MQAIADVFEEDGKLFHRAANKFVHVVDGAELLMTSGQLPAIHDLAHLITQVTPEEHEKLQLVAPACGYQPYTPAEHKLVRIKNAVIFNYPRTDGMVRAADGSFVRETVGSPRVHPGNPFVRNPVKDNWYFERDLPVTAEFDRAFLGFDPAAHNFAHFMGVFLPRIMFANDVLSEYPILFPDLPTYSDYHPGSTRNEIFYGLPELFPLQNGNFYTPLPVGKFKVRDLVIVQHVHNRWDLIFYPKIRDSFTEIGQKALSRYRCLYGKEPPKRLYISREFASHRRILNNAEVEAALKEKGFVSLLAEKMDFWEQAAHFAGAEIVVAPHGAGCVNILFNPGRALFIELHPEPLPWLQFPHSALAKGCRYSPLGSQLLNSRHDTNVDVQRLLEKIGV